MTTLKAGTTLVRKTATGLGAGRFLVVELHPGYLDIRWSGTRTRYPISYGAIYHAAAQLQADKDRAARKKAREAKRRAK